MAIIDSQGQIYIEEEAGKRLGYSPGKQIVFALADKMLYRLANSDDRKNDESIVVCKNTVIDEKYRIVVPKVIRKMYTREAIILEKNGSLYIQFFRLQSDDEWVKQQLLDRELDDRK